jgi:tRNA methyl transferase
MYLFSEGNSDPSISRRWNVGWRRFLSRCSSSREESMSGMQHIQKKQMFIYQDFDLSAVFMRNWDTRDESGTDKGCEWERDWQDVQLVCKKLDLPCELVCVLLFFFFLSSLRFSLNFFYFNFRLIYHRSIGIGFLNHR